MHLMYGTCCVNISYKARLAGIYIGTVQRHNRPVIFAHTDSHTVTHLGFWYDLYRLASYAP
jgi:hypothetical protein